jgi:hypothetical protein
MFKNQKFFLFIVIFILTLATGCNSSKEINPKDTAKVKSSVLNNKTQDKKAEEKIISKTEKVKNSLHPEEQKICDSEIANKPDWLCSVTGEKIITAIALAPKTGLSAEFQADDATIQAEEIIMKKLALQVAYAIKNSTTKTFDFDKLKEAIEEEIRGISIEKCLTKKHELKTPDEALIVKYEFQPKKLDYFYGKKLKMVIEAIFNQDEFKNLKEKNIHQSIKEQVLNYYR